MPMSLGDFFAAAPYAQPVNPRPFTFVAIAKGKVLPGGHANPSGQPVKSTITAAFTFIGDGAAAARVEARERLRTRFKKDEVPLATDGIDLSVETLYHEMWRVICEWNPDTGMVGPRMFAEVDTLRGLVELSELRRIYNKYNEYVDEEHAEVVDAKTFRGDEGGSDDVAADAPRR